MSPTRRRHTTRVVGFSIVSMLTLGLLTACGAEEEETDTPAESAADGSVEDATEETDTAADDDAEAAAEEIAGPDSVVLSEEERQEIADANLTFAINTNNNTDDFSQTVVVGAEAMTEELGIDLIVQNADFDAQQQLSQIDSLIQQDVDAIFLIAVDADAVSTGVIAANEADIPVLIVGGPPSRGEVLTVLNAASYDGTLETSQLLAEAAGGEGEAGVLGIPLALEVIEDRDRGAADGLTQGGLEIVADQSSFDQDELLSQAESMIQANQDLDVLYATWSLAINAALAAVEQSGGDILVAGHDAERTGFEAFDADNPSLVALTAQQPFLQGEVGITALASAILGQDVAPQIRVPNITVTPDNYLDQWDVLYPGIPAPWEE